MKNEDLRRYFDKIKEGTNGDNASNSNIIDYQNGESIHIEDIKEEYYKYLELEEDIDNYIEEEDLDDVNDCDKIKAHFKNRINEDLFMFNQGFLKDFVEYMIIKINKNNENIRKANMIYNKTGNGATTTKITIPVTWAKKLGFSIENKAAKIYLKDNKIIIEKEEN